MGNCYIGTSGWNYAHWKHVFYPPKLNSCELLAYYSSFFKTVEINYSFYRLPEREQFEEWQRQVPKDFVFAVKASQYLTHQKKLKDPNEPLARIIEHARGLGKKLGPILYQLPPRWNVNFSRLREFLPLLPQDIRHVMEFRDESWLTDEVFDLLREYRVGYCIMSAPDLPCVLQVTAPFAYIRMHNGGYETESNYSPAQLEWWANKVQEFLKNVDVYVYFNNDYKGFAVHNALQLKEFLGVE
ncbi:MAG: DUF72 domain-containing protein [Armatimonadota bacterium]